MKFATPSLRALKVLRPAPLVGTPADYLPLGTVGLWLPATGQWWNEPKGRRP